MQMPQSGLAFIGSPVQITGDLPLEILSGHVVRRCRQEEIATLKSHLIRFGMPTMGPVGVAVSPVLVVPNGDADFVLELIDLIHRFEDAPPFPAGGRQPSLGVI